MTFAAGVIIGTIGGITLTLSLIIGMVLEDRFDVLSFVNKHRAERK